MKQAGEDMDARISDLEARLAQQEHAMLQLSDEVYAQQQQIAEFEIKVRHLSNRLQSLSDEGAASDPGPQIPPHY